MIVEDKYESAPTTRSLLQLFCFGFLILSIEVCLGHYMYNQIRRDFEFNFKDEIKSDVCKSEIRKTFINLNFLNEEEVSDRFKRTATSQQEEFDELALIFFKRCFDENSDCLNYSRGRRYITETVKGPRGDNGLPGEIGIPGMPGLSGYPGLTGLTGEPGTDGIGGRRGANGDNVEGRKGRKGEKGDPAGPPPMYLL